MIRCLCLIAILMLAGCGGGGEKRSWTSEGKIRVLATTGMVADLVRGVGGDRVEVITLIGIGLDPHSYELVKGDDENLFEADLIFYSGLGLEHGPSLRRYLEGSGKAVAIGEGIVNSGGLPIWVGSEVDPHIWMDVSLWAKGAEVVAEALSAWDGEGRSEYLARAEKVAAELGQVDGRIADRLMSVPAEKRYLVTTHDAFHYFARRYLGEDWEARIVAPEGLAPEGQLSLTDIQRVVEYLVMKGVEVLFPESNLSRDAIRKIVEVGSRRNLNVRIAQEPLYTDAMGERGSPGETYAGMMEYNGETIARNLMGGR
ncbi:MAG: metal ABC transporter solute-binding protein, Zn/Mn family [Parachlamydiales bacterium]